MLLIPTVTEFTEEGDRVEDIYSRLLRNRIIFLTDEINDDVANTIAAGLLFLESVDSKKDITLCINSPGGYVTAGMAIYDTMQFITPDVITVCMGQASSAAALLLCAGAPGKRYCFPNARVMIHQPLGGCSGQATDIEIQAKEITKIKHQLNTIISLHTGKSIKKVRHDTERDNFMNADEAVKYGLVDQVISKRNIDNAK